MIPRSRIRPGRPQTAGSRTEPLFQLTDDQWFLIEDLFSDPPRTRAGGRPPHPNRNCFEGVLSVTYRDLPSSSLIARWQALLVAGCRWKDLPSCFPSKSVCHQRFTLWAEQGLFEIAWQRLLALKTRLKQLDLTTLVGDGTFVPAKKGAAA